MSITNFFKTLFGTSREEKELRQQFQSVIQQKRNRATNTALAREAMEVAQRKLVVRITEIQQNVDRESFPPSYDIRELAANGQRRP